MRIKPIEPAVFALALSILGGAGACARTSSAGAGGTTAPAQVTTVNVMNDGTSDMEIYVQNADDGPRTRVGIAQGLSTTKLVLPPQVIASGSAPLRFVAEPIGRSRPSVSSSIVITRGDVVTVRIPPG
jgi:hypothetical protein